MVLNGEDGGLNGFAAPTGEVAVVLVVDAAPNGDDGGVANGFVGPPNGDVVDTLVFVAPNGDAVAPAGFPKGELPF